MKRVLVACMIAVIAPVLSAQQQPNLEKGFSAGKAYAVGELDQINLFNGNLNLTIPIGQTYRVGGNLSYSFSLSYAGNNWDAVYDEGALITGQGTPYEEVHNVERNWTEPYKHSNAGIGWLWSFGRMVTAEEYPATRRIYESPDGAQHAFYDGLHDGSDPGTAAAVTFTRDGTYIRRTLLGDGTKLEFPDGTVKEFASDGTIRSHYDLFGNRIDVERVASDSLPAEHQMDAQTCTSSYLAWRITEKIGDIPTGRMHYVYFATRPVDTGRPKLEPYAERLCAMRLAAFQGTFATYRFFYTNRPISRQGIVTVVAEDPDTVSPVVTVPLLTRIRMPDGSAYEVVYDIGENGSGALTSNDPDAPNKTSFIGGSYTGHIRELTLPTRGGYRWRYRSYWFPTSRYMPNYPGQHPGEHSADKPYRDKSAGVWQKDVFDRTGATLGTWTYTSTPVTSDPQAKTSKTTITKSGQATSEHYFNTCRLCGGADSIGYGLPYTLSAADKVDDLYLSSVTTVPGGTRKSYVLYEWDSASGDPASVTAVNRRQVKSLTIFEDGTQRETTFDDFDGVSRYRTESTITRSSNGATELTRAATTNYTPPSNIRDQNARWVLHRYSSAVITDGTKSLVTEACFDDKGFLQRTLARRGGSLQNDLLAVFTATPSGDVAREAFYGGDKTPLPSDFTSVCTSEPGTAAYTLHHTYSHGTRATTRADSSFLSLDLTIDASTGLPSQSRDTATVATSFQYDDMGRLTQVHPSGGAWSEYTYETASAGSGASVTATQWSAGEAVTQSRYHYDGLGRLVQESRKMPVAWSTSWTKFDEFGRKVAATTARQTTDGSFAAYPQPAGDQTLWVYDTVGRVTSVSSPGQQPTTFAFPDTRTTTRTAKVGTTLASGNQSVDKTDVSVTEKTDGAGRLVEVIEDGQATSYAYDLADRLTGVTIGNQQRSFEYDGAGLLTEEAHPENGTTRYEYDARRHIRKRNPSLPDPSGTLEYEYDAAERLRKVTGSAGVLKEFVYHTTQPTGERGLGKLSSATRYNRHPLLGSQDISVIEKFTYASVDGKLSRKTTVVGAETGVKRTFSEDYAYDPLGALSQLTYPACSGCPGLITPARKVDFTRAAGLLTQVPGYTTGTGVTYHPSGLVQSVQHRNSDGNPGPLYTTTDDRGLGRPASLAVSTYCSAAGAVTVTTQPSSTVNLQPTDTVTLSAQASGVVTSWQWYERTATGDVLLHNAIGATFGPVTVGPVTRSYFVRAYADTCWIDSRLVTVSPCASVEIAVAQNVTANLATTASVPPMEGAIYAWTITNGSITGNASLPTITFVPGCSGQVGLTLTTTNQCGTFTRTAISLIDPPTAALGGSATVANGTTVSLRVDLTGAAPWKIRWSDAPAVEDVVTQSPHSREVTADGSRSYSLTSVTDALGCSGTTSGTADVVGTAGCTLPEGLKLTVNDPTIYSSQASLKATATFVDGATYAWTITNAKQTAVSGNEIFFTAGCSGKVTLKVTISTSCASTVIVMEIPISVAKVTSLTPASVQYVAGGPAVTLSAVVTANRGSITWSDGLRQTIPSRGVNTLTRDVSPAENTTYRIVDLRDQNNCVGQVTTASAAVTVCKQPDVTITTPTIIASQATATASVPDAGIGSSYTWTIENGVIVGDSSAPHTRTVGYQATTCSGTVKLTVTVTNSCTAMSRSTIMIPVTAVSATASGSTTIAQGGTASINAILTGTGPWTVRWSDQAEATTVTTSPHTRAVSPLGTTEYTLVSVSGAGNCGGSVAGSAVVTVRPPVPTVVVAAAVSTSRVDVTWQFSGVADRFDIRRNGVVIGQSVAPPYSDHTVQAGKTYWYDVIAVKSNTSSAPSTRDLATTFIFTTPAVTRLGTVSASHILETRQAVNIVRAAAGLGAKSFTDTTLVNLRPKANHITELREALDEARAALGFPQIAYVQSTITPDVTLVAATDVMEIRRGVQ